MREGGREGGMNGWQFASQVLDESEPCASPSFTAEKAETFFKEVYDCQQKSFMRPDWLPAPPSPTTPFNNDAITMEELQSVITRSRVKSTPSPHDQIPYSVLKHCPSLMPALLDLYACWSLEIVPDGWKKGVVKLIPKKEAAEHLEQPSSFRPIALTSCIGKVFTSILKDRLLSYMLQNSFLNTDIQKAFMNGLSGCAEHQLKLASAIQEARQKHRLLTVCWSDLANVYGSVHHTLIRFSLQHYHAPAKLMSIVTSLYSDLSVVVASQEWVTSEIPIKVGVYQGDPLSTVIFNMVMCTLVEALHPLRHLGYSFSQSKCSIHLLQYADDTCLVADGPASCQQLIERVEEWLSWSDMKAKPAKCHSLEIRPSTGTSFDPALSITSLPIPFINKNHIKFLGMMIQVPLGSSRTRQQVSDKLTLLLERVDSTQVTRQQKLKLYQVGVCPRLAWDLTVNIFPLSWVKVLEATATHFLKKWSGLAKTADTAWLYLPQSLGGLNLPSLSLLYKKQQTSRASHLLASKDSTVQFAAAAVIRREEAQQRALHQPMLVAREALCEDPGMSRQALAKRAKVTVTKEDAAARLEHAKSLECQGQVFREVDETAANLWAKVVLTLSPVLLKFSLNAAQDTLPHNVNLSRWRHEDGLSSACRLCGERQTLMHVLNNCPKALNMRRYNERHDAFLAVITNFVKSNILQGYEVLSDLPDSQPYSFPTHIAATDQRPDLVVWNNEMKEVWVVELTICFKNRFDEAKLLKAGCYADLMQQVTTSNYSGTY